MKTFKFRLPEHPELEQAIEDYAGAAEDSADYMYDMIQFGKFSDADQKLLQQDFDRIYKAKMAIDAYCLQHNDKPKEIK